MLYTRGEALDVKRHSQSLLVPIGSGTVPSVFQSQSDRVKVVQSPDPNVRKSLG